MNSLPKDSRSTLIKISKNTVPVMIIISPSSKIMAVILRVILNTGVNQKALNSYHAMVTDPMTGMNRSLEEAYGRGFCISIGSYPSVDIEKQNRE